jgi:hypothetical protein
VISKNGTSSVTPSFGLFDHVVALLSGNLMADNVLVMARQ